MSYTLADYAQAWYMNNSFGAIAYSRSSGNFGCSWHCSSWSEANQTALSQCGIGGEIVAWGQNTYLALAKDSSGSWGTGFNVSARRARKQALSNCGRSGQNARIVLLVQTLRGPEVLEKAPPVGTVPPLGQGDPNEIIRRTAYGAIACSPSSGLYSYAINESSVQAASDAAIRNCRQNAAASDAVAVVSGFNTYLALARCGGYLGSARSEAMDKAELGALQSVESYGSDPEILLVLHTFRGITKTA